MQLSRDDYVRFVRDRHAVYEARQAGTVADVDPIFRNVKFTNVFRILDPGTQYALRLIEDAPDWVSAVTRAVLYRFTNRPEPWEYALAQLGRWPVWPDILDGSLHDLWRDFAPLYGTAYRIHIGRENAGVDKLTFMLERMAPQLSRTANDLAHHRGHPEQMWKVLTELPRVGKFLGMQVLTDLIYLQPGMSENLFVVPGPGCEAGAGVLGLDPRKAIDWGWETFEALGCVRLKGRSPSKMDIQNTFCEFGKFARYRNGGRSRGYTPGTQPLPEPYLPWTW